MSVTALGDAKAYLNVTDNDHDGEIQATLNRAEGMIARRVGPLARGDVTERVAPSGGDQLVLTQPPVAALVSVVDADGATVDIADFVVRRAGVVNAPHTLASRYYDVTYTAGHGTPLPDGIQEGILAMTHHLWSTQRGPQRRPGAIADRTANTVPGAAYVWPYRVTEAIADYVLVGV